MGEENGKEKQYYVYLKGSGGRNRSIALLIAKRRCYTCQQALTDDMVLNSEPEEHIEQIVLQCSSTPDYLLPDTPVKEAIFRLILAGGNEPKTAKEISEDLTERWALSVYPRDVSPTVISRILDNSYSFNIVALPEPDDGEDQEVESADEA